MDIKKYLSKIGDQEAARRFGISERAARSYRTGWRKPKPGVALMIVKDSRGAVTMASIYRDRQIRSVE